MAHAARALRPLAMALVALVASESDYNPTAHITKSSYDRRCSEEKSNHPERALQGREIVPMDGMYPKSTASRNWVQRYVRALKAANLDTLRALEGEDSGIELVQSATFHRTERWFKFINFKIELFDLLENKLNLVNNLWRSGQSLLDIGSGHGFVDAFFALKFDMRVVGYDIPNSYQCEEMLASSLMLNFFDGKSVPEPARSFDGVSFMGVLHHAANNTPSLLKEAGRVARKWIVICEDLENRASHTRNFQHDPSGIFRTHEQWMGLFAAVLPKFELVASAPAGKRDMATTKGQTWRVALGTKGQNPWVYGYALRRRPLSL